MKISVIQPDLLWENIPGNLKNLALLVTPLFERTDIVVLPEMFSTGFSMDPANLSEPMNFNTFRWMKDMAVKGNFGICGSYIVAENGKYFNRWVFVSPENDHFIYNKRHLFSMAGENHFYEPGKSRLVFSFRGIRISPYVCYDLRFPVWSRNRDEYDLAIYAANWPESRIEVWNVLLKARAIENQCYVAGSNRVGTDGKGIYHNGNSQIINPSGEVIASAEDGKVCSVTAEISLETLENFRNKFNVFRDADDFWIDDLLT